MDHCLDRCWGGAQWKWSPILHTNRLYVFVQIIALKTYYISSIKALDTEHPAFFCFNSLLWKKISFSQFDKWPVSSSFSWETIVSCDLDWWSNTFNLSSPPVHLSVLLCAEKVRNGRILQIHRERTVVVFI